MSVNINKAVNLNYYFCSLCQRGYTKPAILLLKDEFKWLNCTSPRSLVSTSSYTELKAGAVTVFRLKAEKRSLLSIILEDHSDLDSILPARGGRPRISQSLVRCRSPEQWTNK